MATTGTVRRVAATLAIALGAVAWSAAAHAEGLDEVARDGEGRVALEALARQPEAMRLAALRVASRPDLVVQVEGIRAWSSRGFEQILEGRSEQDRANLWELVRYPELVEALAEPGGAADPESLVADYPADVRPAAIEAGRSSRDAILRIRDLQRETDDSFAEITDGLDPELASALRRVSDEPEVMSVLAENLNLTVALGEAWQQNPTELEGALAELGVRVAQQDAREQDEWSRAVKEDPELRKQVENAAEEWDRENGVRAHEEVYETVVYEDIRPYPYWYGYPLFAADVYVPAAHSHALWYPRPYWGHRGYSYYGAHHSLVVFDVPSFAFLYWLGWRYPSHHYHSHYAHHQRVRYVQQFAHYGHRQHHARHYVQRSHDRHRARRDERPHRARRGERDRRDGNIEQHHVRLDRDHDRDRRQRVSGHDRDRRQRVREHDPKSDNRRLDADRRKRIEQPRSDEQPRVERKRAGNREGSRPRTSEVRDQAKVRPEVQRERREVRPEVQRERREVRPEVQRERREVRRSAAPREAARQGPPEVRPKLERTRRKATPRPVPAAKQVTRAEVQPDRARGRKAQPRPQRTMRTAARSAQPAAKPPKVKSPPQDAKAEPKPQRRAAPRARPDDPPQKKKTHKPQRHTKRASRR